MIELREGMVGCESDPLCRWTPLPMQRGYRIVDGAFARIISIRTNSISLFRSLTLLQNGDLHATDDVQPDFCWDIVVEEEMVETPAPFEVAILSVETMYTAYFGRKSFFALSPRNRYAAGFLSLPSNTVAKERLMEEYLILLHQLSRNALSGSDLSCVKVGMS